MSLHCHTNLDHNTALNEVIKIDYSTSTSVKLSYQNTIESLRQSITCKYAKFCSNELIPHCTTRLLKTGFKKSIKI